MSVAALQAGGCPESLVAFAVGTRPVGKGAGAVRAPFAFAVGHVSRGKLTVLSTDSVWDAGQGEGTGCSLQPLSLVKEQESHRKELVFKSTFLGGGLKATDLNPNPPHFLLQRLGGCGSGAYAQVTSFSWIKQREAWSL